MPSNKSCAPKNLWGDGAGAVFDVTPDLDEIMRKNPESDLFKYLKGIMPEATGVQR